MLYKIFANTLKNKLNKKMLLQKKRENWVAS